jgi:hypothetical protein
MIRPGTVVVFLRVMGVLAEVELLLDVVSEHLGKGGKRAIA